MAESSFEEILSRDGRLIYSNVGDSMFPLIREGRDLIVIEPVHSRLHRGDVPLYRRDSGQYVLHRVLKVRNDDYVICGDNRWQREYGIQDRHILGVLTAVIRDGRELRVQDPRYRLYMHACCDLYPLRAILLKGIHILRRQTKSGK